MTEKSQFSRKRLDFSIEGRILTSLIMSDKFIQNVALMLKIEYFTNAFSRTIAIWCLDYYKIYGKSIKKDIQNVYESNRRSGQIREDADLIASFLQGLSTKFEEELEESETYNLEYHLDQAEAYFKERALTLLSDNLQQALTNGRILEAHEAVATFRVPDRVMEIGSEPFDNPDLVKKALEKKNGFFKMPGALGKMMGDSKRSTLAAIAAPMGFGKTSYMLDFALQAYYSRLNVAFFSLEMAEDEVTERMARAITASPRKSGKYLFPVWDCLNNQLGTCKKRGFENPTIARSIQKGRSTIIERDDFPVHNYRPCTQCDKFKVTAWWEEIDKKGISTKEAIQKFKGLKETFSSRFKLVSWPMYSAGLQEIISCLRIWENMEGFIPDLIVVDYADLLKPESNQKEERHNLDRIWKGLKALSQSTKTLVLTGTQTRRSTLEKGEVGQADMAEDIRKLAHVDAMWGLSQTPDEKRWGLARIGMLKQRHDEFDVVSQCYILQQLKCGQFCLDSKLKK